MNPLVIIPARAGSKGLPGKNWKNLNGKPLIQYTLEAALELFDPQQICVSTNAPEVIQIAEGLGISVPFLRPEYLATDEATSRDVILHAMNFWNEKFYDVDLIVFLQPTSPFRTSGHISLALTQFNSQIDMVVGVKQTKANPYYVLREEDENGYLQPSKIGEFTRRQDCPIVYEVNGAIYIVNPHSLKSYSISEFRRVKKFIMDDNSSHDIDDALDWIIAESIIQKMKK
jgi:N-acylneuraminate cytidylyltransferase